MELTIPIEDTSRQAALLGTADRHLRLIRSALNVRISARNGAIHVAGPTAAVEQAARVIDELQRSLQSRPDLHEDFIREILKRAASFDGASSNGRIEVFLPSVTIAPRTARQSEYIEGIRHNDLTFCVGPAGTGKTFLAVAVAVTMLKRQEIKRIVLVRPAVEAGEKLGYLPGDLQAKVNPYLRPLFDAMHDMMPFEQARRFLHNDVIEIVPLAFMRGRTLNSAAVILDEAQNTTAAQMLMFLTRLGHHSKMIVTGDDSQSDLAEGERGGLGDAISRLEGIEGVAVVRLTKEDIVRHPMVQKVVEAYEGDKPDAR
ncbi:MAG: PhoH family protein [Planctomycetes bacterium]|nr:PhoH family protein [Planctomycetota bacterium]